VNGAALVAYFLDPSVLVSLLFWWPLMCFSQAVAPLPPSTAAVSNAIERKRFTGLESSELDRRQLGGFQPLRTGVSSQTEGWQ
jgi:hypothetical protein